MEAIDLGSTAIQLVKIPPGTFSMGSPNMLFSEAPVHEVTIGYEFYLGKYLVTHHQWEVVTAQNNPAQFRTAPEHPVDSVSWEDAIAFCYRLSERCGAQVRLPSEAEWEYACRAGTQGEFFFTTAGAIIDETSVPLEVCRSLQEYAGFEENSHEETHPVGLKNPNWWGFSTSLAICGSGVRTCGMVTISAP
jgi:formylglycine-generating enzyme required for sulfatase activity